MRFQILAESLIDLILMMTVIILISFLTKKLIYQAQGESQTFDLSAQTFLEILVILLFTKGLPITLD
jgi:hypothetical protein